MCVRLKTYRVRKTEDIRVSMVRKPGIQKRRLLIDNVMDIQLCAICVRLTAILFLSNGAKARCSREAGL